VHILVCLEGTSYAGKTTVARLLSEKMPAIYGPRVANGWEGQEEKIHKNPDPLARFSFFMKEIAVRSEQVSRLLEQTDVVMDRYLLSVFAYHNVIVGEQLEAELDISDLRQPDCTVLLTVDEATLRQRMKGRPPRHQYESNSAFLLEVQREFLRLIDREKTIVVDTSIQPAEEAARAILEEFVRRGFISSQFPQRE
jgi:thymidylate kinase